MELPDELRELVEKRKQDNPELIEKFGDPTNPDDPRFWSPSTRKEKGVSVEDRLTFLELDMEAMTLAFGPVLKWYMQKQAEEMVAKLRDNPMGVLKEMLDSGMEPADAIGMLSELAKRVQESGSYGPNGHDGPAYAGSTAGLAPDSIVESKDGPIRADQIPGYRNDPSWRPSPDWIDANCMCPTHVAQRAAANGGSDDDGYGSGLYL